MEPDPIKTAARRAARERRLGADASCALCGYAAPDALIAAARTLLEDHHAVGRANDGALTVPLCRNCHAELTEECRARGASMAKPRTLLDKLVAILRALGAFFRTLGEKFLEWAEQVARFLAGLDRECPEWREMPEAAA